MLYYMPGIELSNFIFFNIYFYLYIYLAVPGLSCSMWHPVP